MKKIILTTVLGISMLSLAACSKPVDNPDLPENPSIIEDENNNQQEPSTPVDNPNNETNENEPVQKPEEPAQKPEEPAQKPEEPAQKPEEPVQKPEEPVQKPESTVSIQTIRDTVAQAYGENYLPSYALSDMELKEIYGVDNAWVEEFSAEMPMMSAQVDTFIAVKAKNGNVSNVESALKNYRDYLVNSTMQYPINIPKIQASTVYTKGDYVFFIMLGTIPQDIMFGEDEEAAIKAYVESNKIALDTIDSLIK